MPFQPQRRRGSWLVAPHGLPSASGASPPGTGPPSLSQGLQWQWVPPDDPGSLPEPHLHSPLAQPAHTSQVLGVRKGSLGPNSANHSIYANQTVASSAKQQAAAPGCPLRAGRGQTGKGTREPRGGGGTSEKPFGTSLWGWHAPEPGCPLEHPLCTCGIKHLKCGQCGSRTEFDSM